MVSAPLLYLTNNSRDVFGIRLRTERFKVLPDDFSVVQRFGRALFQ